MEVYNSLEQEYGNFYPSLDTAHDLSERVKTMTEEMQGVSSRIENEVWYYSCCLLGVYCSGKNEYNSFIAITTIPV